MNLHTVLLLFNLVVGMRNLYLLLEWRPRTGGGAASEPPVLQHKLESGTSFKTVPCILVHQNIKENANNHLILRLQMNILFSNRIIHASLNRNWWYVNKYIYAIFVKCNPCILRTFSIFSEQQKCTKKKVVNKNAIGVYTSVICLTAISGVFLLLYIGLHCYMKRFQINNLALGASQIWLFIEFFEI